MKTSTLATEHHHKTLFSLNASYSISNIDDFEALVELESQSDNKNELASHDFSTPTLNVKPKKLPLIIKQLQKLPNGTKIFQNLPNGKKYYRFTEQSESIEGVSHTTPPLNPSMAGTTGVVGAAVPSATLQRGEGTRMPFSFQIREYLKVHSFLQSIMTLFDLTKFILQCLFNFRCFKIQQFLHEVARWPHLGSQTLPPLKGVVVKKGLTRYPT